MTMNELKIKLETALALCEFANCSHATLPANDVKEILGLIKQHKSEIQEYCDFLEDLFSYLIWDTSDHARGARYKIEAFLERTGEKK